MFKSSHVFLSVAQQKAFENGLPILTYHKIDVAPARTRDPFLYVTPKRFDEHLAALRNAGFTTASLDEIACLQNNNSKKAALTFDDGCENVLKNGVPLLAKYQCQAIQFLVSDFIGKRNEWDIAKGDVAEKLMDEQQVRDWLGAGHEIGSHTATHPNLRRVNRREARVEIFDSKIKLEDKFGVAVRHFCFPFGSWNFELQELVREAGYDTACTVNFGVNDFTESRFALKRVTPLSAREWCAKISHRFRRKVLGR
jgi:peptidoglycan/xylan/chitin deacetylase (PgdA/CDA1 family)